jgi:hypothetical protein
MNIVSVRSGFTTRLISFRPGAAGLAPFGMNPEDCSDIDKLKCFPHTRAESWFPENGRP